MDLVTAVDTVTSLINTFSSFRNEGKLTKFVQTAKAKAVQCGIEDSFRDLRQQTLAKLATSVHGWTNFA